MPRWRRGGTRMTRARLCAAFGWAALTVAAFLAIVPLAVAADCRTAPGRGLTLANVAASGGTVRVVGSKVLIASSRGSRTGGSEPTPVVHNPRGIASTGTRWIAVGDLGSILVPARRTVEGGGVAVEHRAARDRGAREPHRGRRHRRDPARDPRDGHPGGRKQRHHRPDVGRGRLDGSIVISGQHATVLARATG